jgi:TRAP-type C4-dicarboxylate transport system substrate-binding protein
MHEWTSILSFHLWQVAPYFYDYGSIGGHGGILQIIMNWDSWNELPPDVQEVMTRLAPDTEVGCAVFNVDRLGKAKERIQEVEATVFTPTKEEMALWDEAIERRWSAWVDRMKAKGINNAEEMLNYWQELRAPYK